MMANYVKLYAGDYYWSFVSYGIPVGATDSLLTALGQTAAELAITTNFDADNYKGAYYYVSEDGGGGMAWTFRSVQKLPTSWYINNTYMRCLVIDGTIVFGRIPTITKTSFSYSESLDRITLSFTISNAWNVSGEYFKVYYEKGDSTPDIFYANTSQSTTSITITINNAKSTYGYGVHTFYASICYLSNSYRSNVISGNITISAPTKTWVYIETMSSSPNADYYVNAIATSVEDGQSELESEYPADTLTEGDTGEVRNDYGEYFIYEVQT